MSEERTEAVLEYPVKLSAEIGAEVDELIAKLESAKELMGEVSETTEAEEKTDTEKDEDKLAIDKLKDLFDGVDDQGIKNLKGFLTNTNLFTEGAIINVLSKAGPYGALAVAIIGLVISSPELYKAIVKALGQKGGPLNMDFRFDEEQQLNQGFDREIQFRRALALDPLITVDTKGFVSIDPTFDGNSLIYGNLARNARIAINESSYGYIHGI